MIKIGLRLLLLLSLILISTSARGESAAFIAGTYILYDGAAAEHDRVTMVEGAVDGMSYELPGVATLTIASGADKSMIVGSRLRWYKGSVITLTLAEGVKASGVSVKCTASNYGETEVKVSIDNGSANLYLPKEGRGEYLRELPLEADRSVEMTGSGDIQCNYIELTYTPSALGGVDGIAADGDEQQPAEYFTLEGRRVDGGELAPGFYIRRQGRSVTKIFKR